MRLLLLSHLLAPSSAACLATFEWQYAFTGFASGADAIGGLIWSLYLIGADGVIPPDQQCGATSDGVSSGADGAACMTFNETGFLLHNGSTCIPPDALSAGVTRYTHDRSLPGCSAALDSFRSATGFTCDCNGDYAFLGGTGGMRAATVWTSLQSLGNALICVLGPLVGSVIDYQGGKKLWWILALVSGVGLAGSSVLGTGYVWVVGITFAFIVLITSELTTIPRTAYLDDVETHLSGWRKDETTSQAIARVAGYRQIMSYFSQFLLVIVALAAIFALSAPLPGILMTLICGVWYLVLYSYIIHKLHARPAKRERNGKGLIAASFGPLLRDIRCLFSNHPEAAKYLLFLVVAQNGLGTTVLNVANPYLLEGPPKADTIQVFSVFLVTLLLGMPWTYAYCKLSARLSFRAILLIIIALVSTAILLMGFVFTSEFEGYGATYLGFLAVVGILIAPGLTWWYSIYWPAFMVLIPEAQVNQYAGVFTTVRTFGLIWHSGPIYAAFVNSMPSAATGHRLGVLTMLFWNVLAVPLLLWVDFDKGRKEAGRTVATKDGKVTTTEVTTAQPQAA